jgi:hypothetical protein
MKDRRMLTEANVDNNERETKITTVNTERRLKHRMRSKAKIYEPETHPEPAAGKRRATNTDEQRHGPSEAESSLGTKTPMLNRGKAEQHTDPRRSQRAGEAEGNNVRTKDTPGISCRTGEANHHRSTAPRNSEGGR